MGAGVSKSIKISVVYPPACTLTANKASYLTGEMIQFSWTKTNTDSLVWKQPAVALGNLVYPLGNLLPAQGAVIPASPVGTHTATLVATNSLGSSSCYTTVVVADPITSGTINDAVSITGFPNLNGTALYTPTVDVSVLDADGVEVYAASLIPVTANTWTHDVSDQIAVGTYTTKLYDEKHKFLDEGVLTVDPEAPEILRVVGEYGALNTISHIAKPTSIYVEPNTHAQVIALISYEPVNWTLNLKRGSNVKRVIVTGYYTSTVTITGAPEYANVPVDETYNGGMHYWTYQPYVGITEDAAVRGLLKNMTGLDIYSWYFQYQATGFNVPGY
jgi:hypothetical protein